MSDIVLIKDAILPAHEMEYVHAWIKRATHINFVTRDQIPFKYYGKSITINRDVAVYGNAHEHFKMYYGPKIKMHPISPLLARLQEQVATRTGITANYIAITRYRAMDFSTPHFIRHLGTPSYPIADVLLGAERHITTADRDDGTMGEPQCVTSGTIIVCPSPAKRYYGLCAGDNDTLILSFRRAVANATKQITSTI